MARSRCPLVRSAKKDDRTGLFVTFKNGVCSICREGAQKRDSKTPVDQQIEKAKTNEGDRADIFACQRILMNPKLAMFLFQELNDIASRLHDTFVNFALMNEDQLKKWLPEETSDGKLPSTVIPATCVDPVHPATQTVDLFYVMQDPDRPDVPWALFPTSRFTYRQEGRLTAVDGRIPKYCVFQQNEWGWCTAGTQPFPQD